MSKVFSNESPEEMRQRGRRYLDAAAGADTEKERDALRRLALVAFEMAEMVELGQTKQQRPH